jgi:hypothetical protein
LNLSLSLSLLEAGILFVDHVEFALPAYDLAINAAFFDGCSYFHFLKLLATGLSPFAVQKLFIVMLIPQKAVALFIPEYDPSPCQIIWRHFNPNFIPRQNADVVHSHFP